MSTKQKMEQKWDPVVNIPSQKLQQQEGKKESLASKIVNRLKWDQRELEEDIKRLEETDSEHSECDEDVQQQLLTPDQLNSLHLQKISKQRYCNLMRIYLQRYDDVEKCLYAFSKIPAIKGYYEMIFERFSTKKLTGLLANNSFFQLMITRFSQCSYDCHFSRKLLAPAFSQARSSTEGYQRLAICKEFLPESSKLKTIIENKFKSYVLQQINSNGFIKNLIDTYHEPPQNSQYSSFCQQNSQQEHQEQLNQADKRNNQDPQVSPIAVTCNSDRSQSSQVNLADICSIQDEQQYLRDLMGSSDQPNHKEMKIDQDPNITFLPFEDLQDCSEPQPFLEFTQKTQQVNFVDAIYKIIDTMNRSNLRSELRQGYKIFSIEVVNELNYQLQNYCHLINPKRFVRVFYYFVKLNGSQFWDVICKNQQAIECILVKALCQFYEFKDQKYKSQQQRNIAKGQAIVLRDQVFDILDDILDAKQSRRLVAKIAEVVVNFAVTVDQIEFMTKICWRNCKLGKESVPKMLDQIVDKLGTRQLKGYNIFKFHSYKLLQKLVDVKYQFPGQTFREVITLCFSKNRMVQNAFRSLVQTIRQNLKIAYSSNNQNSIIYYKKYLDILASNKY